MILIWKTAKWCEATCSLLIYSVTNQAPIRQRRNHTVRSHDYQLCKSGGNECQKKTLPWHQRYERSYGTAQLYSSHLFSVVSPPITGSGHKWSCHSLSVRNSLQPRSSILPTHSSPLFALPTLASGLLPHFHITWLPHPITSSFSRDSKCPDFTGLAGVFAADLRTLRAVRSRNLSSRQSPSSGLSSNLQRFSPG